MNEEKSRSSTTFEISFPVTFSVSLNSKQEKDLVRIFGVKRKDGKIVKKGFTTKLKKRILSRLGAESGKDLMKKDEDFGDLGSDLATLVLQKLIGKSNKKRVYRDFSKKVARPETDKIIKEAEKEKDEQKS